MSDNNDFPSPGQWRFRVRKVWRKDEKKWDWPSKERGDYLHFDAECPGHETAVEPNEQITIRRKDGEMVERYVEKVLRRFQPTDWNEHGMTIVSLHPPDYDGTAAPFPADKEQYDPDYQGQIDDLRNRVSVLEKCVREGVGVEPKDGEQVPF